METEEFQEGLIYNLSLIHTRAEICETSIVQEYEEYEEAGGSIEANPDLLSPELDADAIEAAHVWEEYLIEQESLSNPENFPVHLSNHFGNFISLEEDYGIEVDVLHTVANNQLLSHITEFELSQAVAPKKPP